MELPVSSKEASFGKRPRIKKGYYPAQLLSVEGFTDSDGNLKDSKFGKQLIFEFAVYKPDSDSGEPLESMKCVPEKGADEMTVIIPKFVYHEYKDKKTGDHRTAITPNSAITKILKALGWEFDASKPVDTDNLIGNWVEVNVDDYDQKERDSDETYSASGIKDISPYKGPTVKENLEKVTSRKGEDVKKQIKHKEAAEQASKPEETEESLRAKIKELDKLKSEGNLTPDGHEQAIKNINAKIEGLKKAD
jgi:hypothetical protein